ncbi:MAG: hypothetical protein Ctma_1521 [Catillopecten margaritatus gill symbiont]|uniref:Uncharacterized protein n=1 Tax=Catillopecten margaritatus gill symbiont TaxID=3083288 RepID=A0AAU6PJ58_9GAMM
MQTIQFHTTIKDNIVNIPKRYANLIGKNADVIINYDLPEQGNDNLAFSNASANSISEWRDETEDNVWV